MIVNIGSTSWQARKGGAAAVVRELVNHLETNNMNYINLEVNTTEFQSGRNYYYSSTYDSLIIKNIKLFKVLKSIHKKNRNLILITHNIPVLIISFFWIKTKSRIKHFHYFHGPAFLEAQQEGSGIFMTSLIKLVELLFYSTTRKLIFLSEYFHSLFKEEYYSKIESIIVPYSISIRPFPQIILKSQESSAVFKMLSVRRLQKRMGLDVLIKACTMIEGDFKLDIVGVGPEKEFLEKLIIDNDLEKKVFLKGRLSDTDLNDLIKQCNLTVMPTRSLEGFGISIIDSLILGVPVLAFRVGGMPEILEGLSRNLIIDEFSEEALAQRINNFILNKYLLPEPITCRTYVLNNYSDNYKRLFEWMFMC
jgi:glycosyltransferase involved in cell wall biosynthesis